jgi:hypothetical protein
MKNEESQSLHGYGLYYFSSWVDSKQTVVKFHFK